MGRAQAALDVGGGPTEGLGEDGWTFVHERDHAFVKGESRGCCLVGEDGRRCALGKNRMTHVGVPQSLNVHGSGANRFEYQNQKALWQERLTELLEAVRLPRPLARVEAEATLCFPDRRRRDQGNFRFILEKALGDALAEGGWIEDDDWAHYEFGALRRAYERGAAWTQVTLFPELP